MVVFLDFDGDLKVCMDAVEDTLLIVGLNTKFVVSFLCKEFEVAK